MPRCLVMSERTVGEAERGEYLQSLAVRRELAAAASVHFWTFEHDAVRGRFMEFLEGGSREALIRALSTLELHTAAHDAKRDSERIATAVIWKEVTGGE